jgi:hypothetical protein
MASINDYGRTDIESLAQPKLGGTDGWAAAVTAVLGGSDVPVDQRTTFVKKSGDSMTGHLAISKADSGGGSGLAVTPGVGVASVAAVSTNSTAILSLRSPSGQAKQILLGTQDAKPRWIIQSNNGPETGNNAGSNFGIYRYNDDGTYIGAVLTVARNTGEVVMTADPVTSLGVATKQYVDNVGKWQVYSPSVTGVTVSAASGRYTRIGDTVILNASITFSAAPTADVLMTVPVAHGGMTTTQGGVRIIQASSSYQGVAFYTSSTQIMLRQVRASDGIYVPLNSATPALASGAQLHVSYTYETA